MVQFANPKIATVQYGINFRQPDQQVRFAQGEAERAFSAFVSSPSTQTNMPDLSDPNVPRILFAGNGQKQIAISQLAVQLTLSFDNSLDIEEQWRIIKKNVTEFHSKALAFKAKEFYSISSLIVQVNSESNDSAREMNDFLYSHFMKFAAEDELAGFSVTMGFKREGLYLNLNANVYEKRQFKLEQSTIGQVMAVLNTQDMKVIERGLSLSIDVNTRPRFAESENAVVSEPAELFTAAHDFLTDQSSKVFGSSAG